VEQLTVPSERFATKKKKNRSRFFFQLNVGLCKRQSLCISWWRNFNTTARHRNSVFQFRAKIIK